VEGSGYQAYGSRQKKWVTTRETWTRRVASQFTPKGRGSLNGNQETHDVGGRGKLLKNRTHREDLHTEQPGSRQESELAESPGKERAKRGGQRQLPEGKRRISYSFQRKSEVRGGTPARGTIGGRTKGGRGPHRANFLGSRRTENPARQDREDISY